MPPSVMPQDQDVSNPQSSPDDGASSPSGEQHRLSRTDKVFLVLTAVAIVSGLPLILTFVYADSLDAGAFGVILLAAYLGFEGAFLLSAIPFAWLTSRLFARNFIPRRQYVLASIWTIICTLIAVVLQYISHHSDWFKHIRSVEPTWVGIIFSGLLLGLAGTPIVLLLWLGFRSYRSMVGSKLGAMMSVIVGIICTIGYLTFATSSNQAASQKQHEFTIYLPGTTNTTPQAKVWALPFATKGPDSVRVTTSYGDLFEAAAKEGQALDPKTGLCIPWDSYPSSNEAADYKCFVAFTTRTGFKVYENGSAGKANYHHFFVIGKTFFDLRTYQPDSDVAIVVDSLVPATIDGKLPAEGDVSSQVKPTKSTPNRKVEIYSPHGAVITGHTASDSGVYTANFSQTVASGAISGSITEAASEIATASCNPLENSCKQITTPKGVQVTYDGSTYTMILNYSLIKLNTLTITPNDSASPSKRSLNQSQIDTLIDSLEPAPAT